MEPMSLIMFFVWENLIVLSGVAIWIILKMRWKIPVVVLRYVGNKQRPTVIPTVARKTLVGPKGSVTRLIIKGFKHPFKDYRADHYYPSLKGRGALILWEFKPGWLVPTIPKKIMAGFSEEEKKQIDSTLYMLRDRGVIDYQYNPDLYRKLMVESIDEVDSEYFLQNLARQDQQYSGTWRDFLTKNGAWISIIIIAALLLIGYIVYLDKVPSVTGQCIQSGVEAARNTYLRNVAGNITAGVPLG